MAAEILYCGHSTVIVTTENGKRVIIDPWLEGNPSCPNDLHDPGKIDYICLTHGHDDHASSAAPLAKKHQAMVFATFELATLLAQDGVPQEQLQFMNKGGTVEIPSGGGLAVTLTNAHHSSSYKTSDGVTHYAGEPCGVVLHLESGRTIYHAGDTCLFDDMRLIGQRFKPEVALLPIGDRFTMAPAEAIEAVKFIQPSIAIPIHWGTFDLLTGKPEDFEKGLQGSQTSCTTLQPGQQTNF